MDADDAEVDRLKALLRDVQQKRASDPAFMRELRASQRRSARAVMMMQRVTNTRL